MAEDLSGILSMFNASPSQEERRQAANSALMKMGLGILSANQPSRMPVNPLGIVGQGGMAGMDAYQGSLDKQLAERRANAGLALQGMQLKKSMDQQKALQGLLSESQPQPLGPQAMTQGALSGDIGPTNTNAARLGAMQANPMAQSYTPIPLNKLATAAVGGVNIDPFLKLNEQGMPHTEQIDAGNEILVRDKRTGQVVQKIPKGAAPASIPPQLADLSPTQMRDFLLSERQAGSNRTITNVNSFMPASEAAQKDFMDKTAKNYDALRTAPVMLNNIAKAKEIAASGNPFIGSFGSQKAAVAQFFNNNFGTSIAPDSIADAGELRNRLFQQIMENLKKMDAQPSQMQQVMMMEALGNLNTDPGALQKIMNVTGEVVSGKVALHNKEVESAIGKGVKFPYDPIIKLDQAAPQAQSYPKPSREAINRLKMNPKERTTFEEIFGPGSATQYGIR